MSEITINKILVSTESIMVSKELMNKYRSGKEISVHGCKLNKFLDLVDIKESEHLDPDMLVCFDENLNSLGIIKTGIAGYVMPIKDSSSTFINLYKPMPITPPEEINGYDYRVRLEQPKVAVMHRIVI